MSLTKDELFTQAMSLPPAERDALADMLWRSNSPNERDEVDAAWAEEVERRIDDELSGRSKAVPFKEATVQLRNRLGLK